MAVLGCNYSNNNNSTQAETQKVASTLLIYLDTPAVLVENHHSLKHQTQQLSDVYHHCPGPEKAK